MKKTKETVGIVERHLLCNMEGKGEEGREEKGGKSKKVHLPSFSTSFFFFSIPYITPILVLHFLLHPPSMETYQFIGFHLPVADSQMSTSSPLLSLLQQWLCRLALGHLCAEITQWVLMGQKLYSALSSFQPTRLF